MKITNLKNGESIFAANAPPRVPDRSEQVLVMISTSEQNWAVVQDLFQSRFSYGLVPVPNPV